MSLYIDIQYINELSLLLRNFKKRSSNLWNCSCPICGDSSKNKSKTRFYFLIRGNNVNTYCHNCNYSASFPYFLKSMYPAIHTKYNLEKWKAGATKRYHHIEDPSKSNTSISSTKDITFDIIFQRLDRTSLDNKALMYCNSRGIPVENHQRLYYCSDVKKIGKYFTKYDGTILTSEERLIIPFYNENKEVIGIQARALDKDAKIRYLTFRKDDQELIYGLDVFNKNNTSYVVEGPLDSLFLPNCLAAETSNLLRVKDHVIRNFTTYIFDNQPRNKEVCNQMEKAVDEGCNVFFWNDVKEKDINEYITNNKVKKEDLLDFIGKNTYNGLLGKVRFNQWKRV